MCTKHCYLLTKCMYRNPREGLAEMQISRVALASSIDLQGNNRAKHNLGVVICSFFVKVLLANAVTLREP